MVDEFIIGGMSCDGCVRSVTKVLERIPLRSREVEIGRVVVDYEPSAVRREDIEAAIEDAGFDVLSVTEKSPE